MELGWRILSAITILIGVIESGITLASAVELELQSPTYCIYSKQESVKYSKQDQSNTEDGSSVPNDLLDDNSTELCPKGVEFCYALWQEDAFNNTVWLSQGCWDSSGEVDCGFSDCASRKGPSKAMNTTKFCCCLGNLCNTNVTDAYDPSKEPEIAQPALQFLEQASYKTEAVVIILASVCSLAIVAVATIFICRLWSSSRKPHPDSMHLMEAPPPNSPKFDADALNVLEEVGRGRFGSVCRATLNEHIVAVKIFVVQHRQYFINERDIYTLPHMEHPCLPDYIGSDERMSTDGRPEYLLVLSYAPLGCLQEFLRHNTLDWAGLCKMSHSLTEGLAHLHTEIAKGDKVKPCVAHRDLNSRNVLVKADGSCELCDFGFAIRISGCKYYQNGEEQVAETTSLADVGTLRYMAPEVLEGAVNLRDCETSLKQIDVYALGLVLWEIGSRCSDLYQGMDVPTFRLPFEAEIGLHPSIEQMQVLVTRNKARPLFPDIWKTSNPAIRLLKETIDDCWDQDAEARLTALCVEERLLELPLLWERYKNGNTVSGVSPTVNQTSYHPRPTNLGNLTSNHTMQQQNLNGFIPMDNSDKNLGYRSDPSSSISESTADTTLTTSPNEIAVHPKNNTNNNNTSLFTKFSVPLQPHQGRNPCMERNLMSNHSDDLSVDGNTLRQRSDKENGLRFLLSNDVFDVNPFTENIESNVLIANEGLNQGSSRAANPIPFLQNAVHSPISVMPKQPNLPGNGKHPVETKKKFRFFDRKGEGRFNFGFRSFLERRRNPKSYGNTLDEDQQPLKGSPVSEKANSPIQETSSMLYSDQENIAKSNLRSSHINPDTYHKLNPVITKVCVVGNGYNTREMVASRQTANGYLAASIEDQPEVAQKDQALLDINDNCSQANRSPRPITLQVQSQRTKKVSNVQEAVADCPRLRRDSLSSVSTSSDEGRKIVHRVKTPFEMKKGRFSLYDDRIMTSSTVSDGNLSALNASISKSVPFEMNVVADNVDFCCKKRFNFFFKSELDKAPSASL